MQIGFRSRRSDQISLLTPKNGRKLRIYNSHKLTKTEQQKIEKNKKKKQKTMPHTHTHTQVIKRVDYQGEKTAGSKERIQYRGVDETSFWP